MNTFNHPPDVPIKRGEETARLLMAAIKDYEALCNKLETNSLKEGLSSQDLASCIESVLKTVHAHISDQLPKITTSLLRTRNHLASPIFHLPKDVLLEIFISVIFGHRDEDTLSSFPIIQSVRHINRHLHTLCQVCTTWRDLMVATGTLWSVIPVITISSGYRPVPYGLTLRRAGESPLHLAASIEWTEQEKDLNEVLRQYGSRFRTVNLFVEQFPPTFTAGILTTLLSHSTTGSLSELSISLDVSNHGRVLYRPTGPQIGAEEYIFERDSDQLIPFANLLKSLAAVRMHGVYLHWDMVGFSSRLVELRVEYVRLGYDDAIVPFLQALSSASELQNLSIIAIETFPRPDTTLDKSALPIVSLPKLQSFLLQGLYFNTLELLLSAIVPSSQILTLFLDSESVEINQSRETMWEENGVGSKGPNIAELWEALGPIRANTLMIAGNVWRGRWLRGPMFRTILRAMPGLKTLMVNEEAFDDKDQPTHGLFYLDRSFEHQSGSQDHSLPALKSLHMFRVNTRNVKAFQEMIASHPLQQVVIGGGILSTQSSKSRQRPRNRIEPRGSFEEGYESLEESDEPVEESDEPLEEGDKPLEEIDVVQWLRSNVPDVHLVHNYHCPSEFYGPKWQLW